GPTKEPRACGDKFLQLRFCRGTLTREIEPRFAGHEMDDQFALPDPTAAIDRDESGTVRLPKSLQGFQFVLPADEAHTKTCLAKTCFGQTYSGDREPFRAGHQRTVSARLRR